MNPEEIKNLFDIFTAIQADRSEPFEADLVEAEFASGVEAFRHLIGERVIVRTRMSGVSIGTLVTVEVSPAGYAVTLDDALRLWSWDGAFTLGEVALTGPTSAARIDPHPDGMTIAEPAVELLPMTDDAFTQLQTVAR